MVSSYGISIHTLVKIILTVTNIKNKLLFIYFDTIFLENYNKDKKQREKKQLKKAL